MSNDLLVPAPVVIPLTIAGLLLAVGHFLPRRASDLIAIGTALFALAASIILTDRAANGPLLTWFGGWQPREGIHLAIAFQADTASAAMARPRMTPSV